MTEKRLSETIYEALDGVKESTRLAFKELYNYVEFGEKISKSKLNRFVKAGIYFPKEKKIKNPEDTIGLVLQSMVYDGLVSMKCPDGKEYSLERKTKDRNCLS